MIVKHDVHFTMRS